MRISGCFVFGSAGITSDRVTSAFATGCPLASLTVASKRFWPSPSGLGVVVKLTTAPPFCAAADITPATIITSVIANVVVLPMRSIIAQSATRRNRRALPMTDTELNVMAALAIIGLSSNPNTGYRTPAAIGTPSTL